MSDDGRGRVRLGTSKGGGIRIRMPRPGPQDGSGGSEGYDAAQALAAALNAPAEPPTRRARVIELDPPAPSPPPAPPGLARFEPAVEPPEIVAADPELGIDTHRQRVYDKLGRDFLGVCWPVEGPLAEYVSWAALTTDAHPLYHLAAILPIFAHEAAIRQFRPGLDVAPFFKAHVLLVGKSASSKSTSFARSHKFYAEYRGRANTASEGALIKFEGTTQGVFEALADSTIGTPPRVHALVMHHDEVSSLLAKKRQNDSIQEFLCQLFDAEQALERHQRGIKKHNRTSAVKELEKISTYTVGAQFATTPSGLGLIASPILLNGGLLNRLIWATVPDDEIEHTVRSYQARYLPEREYGLQCWEDWSAWASSVVLARADAAATPWVTVDCPESLDRLLVPTILKRLRDEIDDTLQAFWKRALVQARMLASLFALNDRRLRVTEDDLLLAIAFIERMMESFQATAYKTLITHCPPSFAEAQARVLLGIKKAGQTGLLRRELYTFVPHFKKRELDEVIDRLLDEERIETITVIGGTGRFRFKR